MAFFAVNLFNMKKSSACCLIPPPLRDKTTWLPSNLAFPGNRALSWYAENSQLVYSTHAIGLIPSAEFTRNSELHAGPYFVTRYVRDRSRTRTRSNPVSAQKQRKLKINDVKAYSSTTVAAAFEPPACLHVWENQATSCRAKTSNEGTGRSKYTFEGDVILFNLHL